MQRVHAGARDLLLLSATTQPITVIFTSLCIRQLIDSVATVATTTVATTCAGADGRQGSCAQVSNNTIKTLNISTRHALG